MHLGQIPAEYDQYQWVADMFNKIEGVDLILVDIQQYGEEISLVMTNNKPGNANAIFKLPVKTTTFVDFTCAADCPLDYDINTVNDELRDLILQGALAKAEMLFNTDWRQRRN